jgi:hypothetical protein
MTLNTMPFKRKRHQNVLTLNNVNIVQNIVNSALLLPYLHPRERRNGRVSVWTASSSSPSVPQKPQPCSEFRNQTDDECHTKTPHILCHVISHPPSWPAIRKTTKLLDNIKQ